MARMTLDELVSQLRAAYGTALRSIVLYGSATTGEHIAKRSDYNVLVIVDAFSSDSVPVHLLTREAFELYVRKLRPGGLIGFHDISDHPEGSGGDVPRFWRELKATRPDAREFMDHPPGGYGIGLIRV